LRVAYNRRESYYAAGDRLLREKKGAIGSIANPRNFSRKIPRGSDDDLTRHARDPVLFLRLVTAALLLDA